MTIKYFIYARKSSESEDRQMASIEDQTEELKKIAANNGLRIIEVLTESKSAKNPGRPVFNKMLERVNRGEADGILCWKLNRLARNPIDGAQVSWLLQKRIIKHIQTYDRDYKPEDNVLMMQVELGMANQFVKDLSVDVKRGTRRKAERGWNPAPVLPAGYKHNMSREASRRNAGNSSNSKVDKEIVIESESFRIVKKLWKLLLTGEHTMAEIKQKGDNMCLRSVRGSFFALSAYYKLFSNPFYCGYFYWRDANGVLQKYRGRHKTMITEEDFEKAQVLLGRNPGVSRKRKYYYPFKNLMSCGECKGRITVDRVVRTVCSNCHRKFSVKNANACPRCNMKVSQMKNPHITDIAYYRCTKKRGTCSQGYLRFDKALIQFQSVLDRISISEKTSQWLRLTMNLIEHTQEDDKRNVKNLEQKISELQERVQNIIRMRADNHISQDQFLLNKRTAELELAEVENQIAATIDTRSNWKDVANKICDNLIGINELFPKSGQLDQESDCD